jgi:type III pantothenate kinase
MTQRRWLTIDAGNSTLDVMVHVDCGTSVRERLAVTQSGSALARMVEAHAPTDAALVSVRTGALDEPLAVLASAGVRALVVGRDLQCPLPLDYSTPHTLGPDRWLGAFAAHAEFGRAVVIDAGTATTVNLVEADGTFRGGPIAPGLSAILAGMAAVTPALPAPNLQAEPSMPPRSSQAAVDAGVLVGWCGMVERLVAEMVAVARGPATVLVTGGRAELLMRHGRVEAAHVPDLIHRGLRRLAQQRTCES